MESGKMRKRKCENEIKYHKQKLEGGKVRRLVEDIATEATLIKKLFDKKSARHLSGITTSKVGGEQASRRKRKGDDESNEERIEERKM